MKTLAMNHLCGTAEAARRTVLLLAFGCARALGAGSEGAPPEFVGKPKVARSAGGGLRIEFAVSRPTDAEVAVLDGQGKVVRHLAAGMLGGERPPPEPLRPGLVQALAWDGRDDAGRPLPRPPREQPQPAAAPSGGDGFSVRVRLGLKPEFDRFMLYEPDALPAVNALAVGPGGQIYAFYKDPTANGNQGGFKVRIMTRAGRFVRQILPFPADLPYDKVKASGAFLDDDGSLLPHLHNWHMLRFYPDTVPARNRSFPSHGQPVVDPNGRLYWIIGDGRLCALDPDGGIPYESYLSEPLFTGFKHTATHGHGPALCMSSDGRHLYATSTQADDGYGKNQRAIPCVWRIDTATRKAEVFVGRPDQTGATGELLAGPRGVAAGGGLLYVADPVAGRVAVFKEQDRSFVGEIKCTLPHIVQVHPKSGAVYVVSYVPEEKPSADGKCRIKDANLLKYAGWREAQPTVTMALPRTGLSPNEGTHRIALDATVEPPLLWAPGLPYARAGGQIACYRDAGDRIEPVDMPFPTGPWGNGPRDLVVDRARGHLYVKVQGEQWHQFEEASGKYLRLVRFDKNKGGPYMGSSGAQLGVDASGDYVLHCWGEKAGLMRWSSDLKPLNWEGKDTHRSDWGGMMTFQLNYMALLGNDIYVIKPVQGPHNVEVYDMGLNLKRRVVWNARRGSCLRVDAKGNVYLTVPLRPEGRDFEEFFDGKLGKIPDYYNGVGNGPHYWYTYMAGAIVKFPPDGGAFHWTGEKGGGEAAQDLPAHLAAKPRVRCQYFLAGHHPHTTCEVQGADWVRFGYTPYSETYGAGTPVCMCEGAGFDVDGWGRIWHVNLFRFRVEVADNANNTITTFGKYGNQDSGPEGRIRTPAIPLAWPTYVATSDDYAYVNDTIGLRVVRVKIGCAREESCPLP